MTERMCSPALSKDACLRHLHVRIHCRLEGPAFFPAYMGSMLRGAMGSSLRRGLCMTREADCLACILGPRCIFPRLFSSRAGEGARGLPPPFCLEPPEQQPRPREAGEVFVFGLRLFAHACEFLPFFVQAFRMAGQQGLGSPRRPVRFEIVRISHEGRDIYDAAEGRLESTAPDLLAPPRPGEAGPKVRLRLLLLTPLRFKAGNQLAQDLNFFELFRLMLRRVRALWSLEGQPYSLESRGFASLRQLAADASVLGGRLGWHDWSRYSGRQERFMKLGGLLGQVDYACHAAAFADFFRVAGLVHIGKLASFGLGRVAFSPLPNSFSEVMP